MVSSPLFLALVLVGVIAIVVVVSFTLNRRRRDIWKRFAKQHGLSVVDNGDRLMLRGDMEGSPIEISIVDESSDAGTLGVQVLHISTPIPNLPDGLEVESAPGLVGSLRKTLETDAADTGDENFDRLTVVKCDDESIAAGYLSPARKLAIESLIEKVTPAFVDLEAGMLRIDDREMVSRIERLEEQTRDLLQCAEVLNRSDDG